MDIYRCLYGSIMNHFCLPIHAGANNMLPDADLIWYLNKWTQWLHSQTFVKTSHRAQKVDLQSKNSSVPLCRSVQSPSETSGCSLAEVQSSCWSSFSAATSFSMSWRSNVAGRLLVELQGPRLVFEILKNTLQREVIRSRLNTFKLRESLLGGLFHLCLFVLLWDTSGIWKDPPFKPREVESKPSLHMHQVGPSEPQKIHR